MQCIGLIDCNNFFVSCERLFRPDLKNTPVVVLSSNDGCVVARSQEIKDSGIPMGVPYFQIKDTLADIKATVFSSHFSLYRDISRRVFNVIRREIGYIEEYSIDECFFYVSPDQAESVARRLQAVVYKEVGVPVSVGVALSKTQAKYANSVAKRTTGVCVLTSEDWIASQVNIRLSDLWGVGRARAEIFARHQLFTVADYLAISSSTAGQLFGKEGVHLWSELNGLTGKSKREESLAPKSIMSTRSFAKATMNKGEVKEALLYHLYEVVRQLSAAGCLAVRLRVLFYPGRHSDFVLQGVSSEAVLTVPTRDLFALQKTVTDLLEQHFRAGVPYKKAGIVVITEEEAGTPLSLFRDEAAIRRTELTETILKINARHKTPLIRLAGALGSGKWRSRTEALSPCYTTRWSDLRVVGTDLSKKPLTDRCT